ncbi:7487_t:CDS:2 [Scutellospora calospora]|uniref:7487_t:CDS:1 n=1 Tax=Scutellospora calospora TaxID=85575 RepID=A0ACA9JVV5_9GLOM|nr:7487_t:CDS:2 [Scutellospora calospora]
MPRSNNNDIETDGDFYPGRSDSWNALDGTWTRRFLREVIEMDRYLYNDMKNKVISFQLNCGKGTPDQLPPDSGKHQLPPGPHLRDSTCSFSVDSEHADLTIYHFWEEVISKRNRLKLRKELDAESIELLRISSKFQSQNIQKDYEDLMNPSCDKHFLDSTANNEIIAKKIKTNQDSSKKKLPPNMLPDGTRFDKATPLNLIPSDESEDESVDDNPSLIFVNDDEDDENDNVPDPNEIPDLFPNPQMWSLPSGKSVEDIFAMNVSKYSKAYKQKKRLTSIEKATLRYGASKIIDLSAHMRAWFLLPDRHFMTKNHETLLTIPELPDDVNTFILKVEKEFSVRATTDKTISDRCRSGRINQSILNGLLRLDWKDEQIKLVKVPFIQFAGINGQMLIEVLMNGFYIISGPKFQLPTKLAQIEKLKSTVKVTKYIMEMYREISNLINNLEIGYHTFDDIFKVDEPDTTNEFSNYPQDKQERWQDKSNNYHQAKVMEIWTFKH